MMIRRGTGRTPPVVLGVLLLFLLILGFNCWTLSTQNGDLQQEIEKIQAEVKISAVKAEQSEKKTAALSETVHEMEEISNKLQKKLHDEDEVLRKSDQNGKKKDYEITTLKAQLAKLQEQVNSQTQLLEEREVELSKGKETNIHLASERDDAVEAIAEKDSQLNSLKRQLEQTQDELAALKREQAAVAKPKMVPGPFNLPNIHKRESEPEGGGVLAPPHGVVPAPPGDAGPQGNVPAQPLGPGVMDQPVMDQNILPGQFNLNPENNGPVVVERPQPPVHHQPIQAPVHVGAAPPGPPMDPMHDVLAPPPQNHDDNLDAAVDEYEKMAEDDMMDDQDEEGNEVKQPNELIKEVVNEGINDENNAQEDLKDPPRLFNEPGLLKVPRPKSNQDDLGDPGNYYLGNLDMNNVSNIRNIPRAPDFH